LYATTKRCRHPPAREPDEAGRSRTPAAYSADYPTRRILDRVGDKGAALILFLVRDEPMRFSALRRTIEGISQKMPSQVVKSLERDGLIRRRAVATVPVTSIRGAQGDRGVKPAAAVMPRFKRDIQYVAASQSNTDVSGML
jgi:DNA-binding HxlR family transcriptional regulator